MNNSSLSLSLYLSLLPYLRHLLIDFTNTKFEKRGEILEEKVKMGTSEIVS
jgi:hypothetical protein